MTSPSTRRVRPLLLPVLLSATVLAATLLSGSLPASAAPARPTAVVVLGDSAASGEGAGDYLPGTRGEGGNWCHRSAHAYVHRTGLAQTGVNLACSGADTAAVRFGAAPHNTEGSQAQRLVQVAREHRVTAVVLQVGGNDDIALTTVALSCVVAFVDVFTPPCRETLAPQLPGRLAATAGKVEAAAADVREAMRRAGYRDRDYTFVLASYAAPVTETMVTAPIARGCPYSRADAGWGRTVLFPQLSETLRGVAGRTGAAFLDLTRATEGFEACSRFPAHEEWQRRITVDPYALVHGRLDAIGRHLWQESFHPAALAHVAVGRCLGDLVRGGAPAGSCVARADGTAVLETAVPAPA